MHSFLYTVLFEGKRPCSWRTTGKGRTLSSCSSNYWDFHTEVEAWACFQRMENLVRAFSSSILPWQYKELIFALFSFSVLGAGAPVAQASLKLDMSPSVTLTS